MICRLLALPFLQTNSSQNIMRQAGFVALGASPDQDAAAFVHAVLHPLDQSQVSKEIRLVGLRLNSLPKP